MKLVRLVVLVTLTTASCSADEQSSTTSREAVGAANTAAVNTAVRSIDELVFEQPDEPLAAASPLSFVVTASDVDANGSPVDISGNFSTDAPKITSVIDIGPLTTATAELVVGWFHLDGPTPAEPIFEHRLDVRAGDHAYSMGLSPGVLALGRYEIVATIGDVTRTALWMVAEERQAARSGLRVVPSSQPAAPQNDDDDSGHPPESGESGSIPGEPPAGTSTDGCALSVTRLGSATAFVTATGCLGDTTQIGAGPPSGPLRVIGTAAGDFSRPVGPDPCSVGGSDLPESELMFGARITSGPHSGVAASTVLQLGPDEIQPRVMVEATPAENTFVFAGDTILLVIQLDDIPGIGASGVRDVEVTTADGTVLATREFATTATPCDKTRLHQELAVTATVPDDPEDIFWIHVSAGDIAGQRTDLDLAWHTTARWIGTLEAAASGISTAGIDPPNNCTAHWSMLIDIPVEGRGAVRGRAEVEALRTPRCVPWDFVGEAVGHHFMTVTGTFDGSAFNLSFHSPVPSTAAFFDVALFTLYRPELQVITVPVKVNYSAGGAPFVFTFVDGPGEYTATLDGYLYLSCECSIGG